MRRGGWKKAMSADKKNGVDARTKLPHLLISLAVLLAVTVLASSPLVTATTVEETQEITSQGQAFNVNYEHLSIRLDGNESSKVLVGQVIQFYNGSGGPSGVVTLEGISGEAEEKKVEKYSDDAGRLDTALTPLLTGTYLATCADGCDNTTIIVEEPYLKLALKRSGKSITSIPVNTTFTVELSTNLDPHDGVNLEVKDPSGNTLKANYDGTVFDGVNVDHVTDLSINTAGWELGTYTFRVSTEEDYARGLETQSDLKSIAIVSGVLKIVAAKTEIVELENLKLTVTGLPDTTITVLVERNAEHAVFPASKNDNPASTQRGAFNHTIDADGKREYLVYFDRTGAYTVRVRDESSGSEDYVTVSVSKKHVTFTTPETCSIGADLVINGTANTGKTVDIAINDRLVKVDVAIDTAGKFEVKLPTPDTPGTSLEDAIKIKGFIDGMYTLDQDVAGADYDGSTLVLMMVGGLTAETSVTVVAPGDFFTLSGTAPGSQGVDILIVAPKGGGDHGMNPTNSIENDLPSGMSYETAAVSSSTSRWSLEVEVDEDAATGTYLIFALTPGKNQLYDGMQTPDLLAGLATKYFAGDLSKFGAKTQEQIRAMLVEVTTGAAGSDDYLRVLKLSVRRPEVALYVPAEVIIGENLTIAGSSNREGHTIILKVKGPLDLGTKFVTVLEGQFDAIFSTTEALTGEYTVEASDGEGHTDTATVTIIPPARVWEGPTATPEPSSTPSIPTPSEEPESTPTAEPVPTEPPASPLLPVPGFEVIAGLIALLTAFLSAATARRGKR
jgi:hypothetical protein